MTQWLSENWLPFAQGVLLLLFCIPAVLLPVRYFKAVRPRQGTIEWIRRMDPPAFQPPFSQAFHLGDLFLSLIALLLSALLSLLLLYSASGGYMGPEPFAFFPEEAGLYVPRMILTGLLSLTVYCLLRCLCSHSTVAFTGALLVPFLLDLGLFSTLLVALALLFFWLWMTRPANGGWFSGAMLFLLWGICYGAALVFCFPSVFLAPLFLGGWLRTLVYRFRNGSEENRARRLFLSLFLALGAFVLGAVAVWILYNFVSGRSRDWNDLRNWSFYGAMGSVLPERLRALVTLPPLSHSVYYGDLFPLLLGLGALPPLFHGLIRLRDGRCLWILLLLGSLTLMWILSGTFLLELGLLTAFGWVWESLASRRRGGSARASALLLMAGVLTDSVLILIWRFVS